MEKKATRHRAEFVRWFGPTLDALRTLGGSATPQETSDWIAEKFNIPDSKREELMRSGAARFHNQVQWARQYLVWEGLIESSRRGVWALTPKGAETHLTDDKAHDIFSKWVAIHAKSRKQAVAHDKLSNEERATDDVLPDEQYKADLLQVLKSLSPSGFERICQRLLREHGFEKVEVTGGSRDQGIDGIGILQLNPFVKFKILFQCKKYSGTVSRAHVGDFRSAMFGRADKGIILTTGSFSSEAIRETNRDGAPPIELVDGEKLVELFLDVELGLRPKTIYEVDNAFFNQFMA